MSFRQQRLTRLEVHQRRRQPVAHVAIVHVPWDIFGEEQQWAWIDAHVTCPCGTPGCERLRMAIVPEMAPDAETWYQRHGDDLRRTPEPRVAAEESWWRSMRATYESKP